MSSLASVYSGGSERDWEAWPPFKSLAPVPPPKRTVIQSNA